LARTTKFMLTEEAHHVRRRIGRGARAAAHVRRDESGSRPTIPRASAAKAPSTCRRSSAASISTSP
jgi:hypothetical protein